MQIIAKFPLGYYFILKQKRIVLKLILWY